MLKLLGIALGLLLVAYLAYYGFQDYKDRSSVLSFGKELKQQLILPLCESSKNFSQADFKKYFTVNYQKLNTFDQAKIKMQQNYFPPAIPCATYNTDTLSEVLKLREKISVSQGTALRNFVRTYYEATPHAGMTIRLFYTKENDVWKVDGTAGSFSYMCKSYSEC